MKKSSLKKGLMCYDTHQEIITADINFIIDVRKFIILGGKFEAKALFQSNAVISGEVLEYYINSKLVSVYTNVFCEQNDLDHV
jgi:hypothetical protein